MAAEKEAIELRRQLEETEEELERARDWLAAIRDVVADWQLMSGGPDDDAADDDDDDDGADHGM
jgi:hypothetical protein